MQFKSPSKPGRYVVALQIEDFNNNHQPMLSTKPKSSVALQFVVKVTKNAMTAVNGGQCYNGLQARFVDVEDVDDSDKSQANKCIQGNLNEPLTLELIVQNNDVNDPV